ncbi:MAG TPA: hypothetical protein VGL81_18510 [Polyangiaceae bacterium]|jgi:hypothetical protein
MLRRPAFAAAWGLVLSACALDLGGLGAAVPADEGGAATPTLEAAAADQLSVEPEGVEAGEVDTPVGPDGDAQLPGAEASTAGGDAAGPVEGGDDASTGPSATCDEDGDGYLAKTSACGGTDCCDQDAHVHPGQKSFFSQPGACGGYDYDCDGQETPEYGAANCQWSTFSCSGDGFAAPIPLCGVFGTFTSCSIPWYDVLSCAGSNAQQAQACH